MFHMICKDLRISPLRTFLTGFSMFIGIIAMIAAVLVGMLGRESLLSINAQIFGYSPTYSILISEANFRDTENMEKLLEKLQIAKSKAIVINPNKEFRFAPMDSIEQLKEPEKLYRNLNYVETVYTTAGYNEIYNLPIFKGKWFDKTEQESPLEVVVNKRGYDIYNSKYVVLSSKYTLNLTPFNVVGIVNDGRDWPTIYVNIKPLLSYMPNTFSTRDATVYWHTDGKLSMENMRVHISDILYDTIGGKIENITRSDSGDSYTQVIDMLQLGLIISATLLLLVAVLGQINIGLSSLEQRTHELLIRRALGASKYNLAILVSSSLLFLSVVVCIISILISVMLVYSIRFFLPNDSPVTLPSYPITAALIAMGTSVFTALLGGLLPAIKASKLEPALALR